MRILLINYEYPPLGGGGGKQAMYLAREYSFANEVYYLTAGWTEFGICQTDGYTLHRIKTKRKRTYRCTDFEMIDFVRRAWTVLPGVVDSFKPDVVHIFFTIPTGLLSFHPRLRTFPIVVSVRGSDVPFHSPDIHPMVYRLFVPVVRRIWKKSKAVVCNSSVLKQEVLSISKSLNVDVIYNGLELSRFVPSHKQLDNKKIQLLFVGRLIPLKQIDILILSMARLRDEGFKNIHLRITGRGFDEDRLKQLSFENKLDDFVTFSGEADYFEIEKEYQQSDIYIQLSKVEGMSNTIMEAMACGLPVITSNVGGISELICENGIIIGKVSVDSVSKAIKKYLENNELIEIHGKQSVKTASFFTWKSITDQYISVLKRCVE